VKQTLWGSGGFEPRDHGAGIAWGISGFHRWHYLPTQTQFISFSKDSAEEMRSMADSGSALRVEDWQPAIDVRTKDNNTVSIDVTVNYRIIPGQGHRILEESLKNAYRDRVRSQVTGVLREELAKLSSEEYQSTEKRIARTEETLTVLRRELAEFFVEPLDVFIRQVYFPADYERKLQEKQYLNQRKLLDFALTGQATQQTEVAKFQKQTEKEVKSLTQEWEKRIQTVKSEMQVHIAGIQAAAEVYARETRAQGEAERDIAIANGKLAVEKAEALRDELRNAALDTRGGRIRLALDAVENLRIPRVVLNSDDPAVPMLLDLDRMTELLVGETREPARDP
jgi:regulator of protease activity HflC (stomatin/prohibitin superfamily)